MNRRHWLPLLALMCFSCAKASAPESASPPSAPTTGEAKPAADKADATGVAGLAAQAQIPANARKIIRNAELDIVVAAYKPAAAALTKLAQDGGGYVAQSDVHHEQDRISTATWVLRIPAQGLDGALQIIRNLGHVTAEKVTAEDVTEQWTDLKARLDNAKAAEARLQLLLQQKTEKLADVLEVERELTRVRGDVEVMEGRLRLLDHRIDLSTLTVRLRVEEKYVPPVAPTFWSRLVDVFTGSIENLVEFAELLLTMIVALAPWALVLGVLGWLGWRSLRAIVAWLMRRGQRKPPNPQG